MTENNWLLSSISDKRQESAKPIGVAYSAQRPALSGVRPELKGAFTSGQFLFSIHGLPSGEELQRAFTSRQSESIEHLWSDRLSRNVAIFEKSNRVIINDQGVFIPQEMLGQNVEVSHKREQLPGGGIRVVVSAYPRNKLVRPPRHVAPIDCSRELQWLKEHRQEYMGQWVALDGDRLVAHGMNGREVYDEARQLGVEVPALVKIDPSDDLPFGGW